MSRENVEIVRRWIEGVSEDRMPPLDLCDERIEIRNVAAFPVQGPYDGHEGVRWWVSDMFDVFDEARVELDETIDAQDGETIVTMQRVLGRTRHAQLQIDVPWAAVWTVQRGKVTRVHGYAHKARALEVAGLSE
jgi:ketosteroid isomerase-like protein